MTDRDDMNDRDAGMRANPPATAIPDTDARNSSFTSPRASTAGGRSSMLTGTFRDRSSAESAYDSLVGRGYTDKDINLMMSDETRKKHFDKDEDTGIGNKAAEGGTAGAVIGGSAGLIIGALTAAGTLALPGLGLVLAGPIAAGLAGLGVGGAAGGLIGALVGAGIPEERAKKYESDIKEGGIVMGVKPRSDQDAEHFQREWRDLRGENVYY